MALYDQALTGDAIWGWGCVRVSARLNRQTCRTRVSEKFGRRNFIFICMSIANQYRLDWTDCWFHIRQCKRTCRYTQICKYYAWFKSLTRNSNFSTTFQIEWYEGWVWKTVRNTHLITLWLSTTVMYKQEEPSSQHVNQSIAKSPLGKWNQIYS